MLAVVALVSMARGAIIERMGTAHMTFTTLTLQPAPGATVPIPETGLVLRRISDVALTQNPDSPNPWHYTSPGAGIVNNYSRSYTDNIPGDWILGFSITPLACKFDSNFAFKGLLKTKSGLKVGDSQEVKWSDDAAAPYWVYYFPDGGPNYCRQDIRLGPSSEERIVALPSKIKQTADGSPSGGYVAEALYNGTVRVIDIKNKRLLPGVIVRNMPNGVDISPALPGQKPAWVMVDNNFYRFADMETSQTVNVDCTRNSGHGGWAIDLNGDPVFVWQNASGPNTFGLDWICKFNPRTNLVTKLFYTGEFNGSLGYHISTNRNASLSGFALVSTYASRNWAWGRNECFALALGPAGNAPIQRIAQMPNFWIGPQPGSTSGKGNFYTEAYANLNYNGDCIYFGGNWYAKDNLELYRIELPWGFFDPLLAAAGGAPIPTPTASPVPTATPKPTPSLIYATGSNFTYDSAQGIGSTTSAKYIMIASFAPEYQASHSTAVDAGCLLQFQIPARPISKAMLYLRHHSQTEFGAHPTGRESIPVRRITGAPFTPAFVRYPTASGNEGPFDGASWQNRIQTTRTTERWSALSSAARVSFSRHAGDLSTALEPITSATPRLNFSVTSNTSTVDLTAYVQPFAGSEQLLSIFIDTMNAEGPDRFGTQSQPNRNNFRGRQAIYGNGYADKTLGPRLVIE